MLWRTLIQCSVTYTVFCALFSASVHAEKADEPAYTDDEAARNDPSFKVQGEYVGTLESPNVKLAVQLIALGNGKYSARTWVGGLPGDGWNGEELPVAAGSTQDDGSVLVRGQEGDGLWKDGVLKILVNGQEIGELEQVHRKSKTLEMAPPEGAIVLFDGTSTAEWNDAVLDGKSLAFAPESKGTSTKRKFGSHRLHLEFRTPFMPESRGQGRGNSGLYVQSRYEVQMLDSFGLEGKQNECGGIYSIASPKLNMCFPPLVWQTYDVEFTAAKYDSTGNVSRHPRITVRHNDVLIHDDVELPHSTTASPMNPGPEDAPIFLQNHSNPVRYRNIWVIPTVAAP